KVNGQSMIRVTNLQGADLNAACSGLAEARPMDGPSNESSQRTCGLKYDGYNARNKKTPLRVSDGDMK
ncbi:hypothetical protein ACULX5_004077, partial [Yersinia enterocolitica]